ncbi:hypothetical protein OCV88_12540 [Brotonthovivens ammoniilytica]|uniref:Ribosomal protein L29 n=1 Tax=Brotonthovivens ammoniilytica TaxID=2981725 RepID=A0ABT2TNF6_9FIRM|nr:hypothetical protein [Brotonthovivens ammoniilytica]MCU6763142.1 hypothetical protein [Brotonthovivens ammoniilytica]
MLKQKEKNILLELICKEQTQMLQSNQEAYNYEKYKLLEKIKIKVKDTLSSQGQCMSQW